MDDTGVLAASVRRNVDPKLAFGNSKLATPQNDTMQRIIESTEESYNTSNEHDGWILYYSNEGYPYYYNSVTHESVWANYNYDESADSSVNGPTGERKKVVRSNADVKSTTKSNKLIPSSSSTRQETSSGNSTETGSSDDDSDYDSSNSDDSDDSDTGRNSGSSDSDYDSDSDSDSNTRQKDDGYFDSEFELKFRQFLKTPEGLRAVEEEQARIEARVTKITKKQEKRQRKYQKQSSSGLMGSLQAWGSYFQSFIDSAPTVRVKSRKLVKDIEVGEGNYSDGSDEDESLNDAKKNLIDAHRRKANKHVSFSNSLDNKNVKSEGDISSRRGSMEKMKSSPSTSSSSDNDSISSDDSDIRLLVEPYTPNWLQANTIANNIANTNPEHVRRAIFDLFIGASRVVIATSEVILNGAISAAQLAINVSGENLGNVPIILWGHVNNMLMNLVDGSATHHSVGSPATPTLSTPLEIPTQRETQHMSAVGTDIIENQHDPDSATGTAEILLELNSDSQISPNDDKL